MYSSSSSSSPVSLLLPISILIIGTAVAFTCDKFLNDSFFAYGSTSMEANLTEVELGPHLTDQNLKLELVVEGLKRPTSMAFLGQDDILILEKNRGTVKRIVNGNILEPPLLDIEVANEKERGMLGIAVLSISPLNNEKDNTTIPERGIAPTYVFLYFTESSGEDGIDECPLVNYCEEGTKPQGNRLYRYGFEEGKLVNSKLLLDLPASPGSDHIGGAVTVGPDRNIYLTSGDGHSCSYNSCDNGIENTVLNSQNLNVENGKLPNGRGGILRITEDGLAVREGENEKHFDEDNISHKYYAYGIRNSFGIDFDPLSGKLWDTENGPAFGDEINLVESGFNSGWLKIQGLWPITNYTLLLPQLPVSPYRGYIVNDKSELIRSAEATKINLVDFGRISRYSDPEFTWNITVGVTALKFLNSNKLGEKYENDMFVADYNYGRLYHFDLDEDRTSLILDKSLSDKIAHSSERDDLKTVIFGEGFDAITDVEVGPDGYLYVVSHKDGKIFRIVPTG